MFSTEGIVEIDNGCLLRRIFHYECAKEWSVRSLMEYSPEEIKKLGNMIRERMKITGELKNEN